LCAEALGGLLSGESRIELYVTLECWAVAGSKRRALGTAVGPSSKVCAWAAEDYSGQLEAGERLELERVYL
jgi:hypothetical protein